MRSGEVQLTNFLKSRGFTWILIVASIALAWSQLPWDAVAADIVDTGLWLPSPESWFASPVVSLAASIAVCLAVGVMMALLNKVFNLLRTVSVAYVGYFMLMQAATPMALSRFDGGETLALAAMVWMMLLFGAYQQPQLTRRVFLIFFIAAAGSLFEYGFILYVPLLLLGCHHMRIISLRALLAALVGLLTPVWILWAFGVIDLSAINLPPLPDPIAVVSRSSTLPTAVTVGITLLAGLYFGVANILKVMSLNARSRAYNATLSAFGIFTGVLCIIDFNNIAFYAALLNATTAMQVGLYMRLYSRQRGYAALLVLLGCYAASLIWQIYFI